MKRWICFMIAASLLVVPGAALGSQSPLQETARNRVIYPSEGTVSLVSYYATLTVRGSTSVNAILTLRNTGAEPLETYIATAYPLDHNYQVDRPQAQCEGKTLPLRRLTKAQDASEGMPQRWYGWKLYFEPGQTRVLTIAYTTDTKIESDGTRCVIFPLYYLRAFEGQTGYVQVVADMDYHPPYAYDPAPSPNPDQINNAGCLTWTFADGKIPDEIVLRFKPAATVIGRYLEQQDKDPRIREILSLYDKNLYEETIEQLDAFLYENPGYDHKNALLTLKSLCLQKLMRLDEALDLLSYLAANPGFGGMEGYFRNRIIYETAWIMAAQGRSEEDILEYLTVERDMVSADSFFSQWLDREIWRLTPRPTPTPEPTPVPAVASTPAPEDTATWFDYLGEKTLSIGNLDIPILYLVLGGLGVLMLLLIILLVRSKRSRRSRYRFR